MDREDVLDRYNSVGGIITSPGKFGGQPIYAPYLWDVVLEGGSETIYTEEYIVLELIEISGEDRGHFPELEEDEVGAAVLYETNDGFVYCLIYGDRQEAEKDWGF